MNFLKEFSLIFVHATGGEIQPLIPDLLGKVDPAAFSEMFGVGISDAPSLIEAKTLTFIRKSRQSTSKLKTFPFKKLDLITWNSINANLIEATFFNFPDAHHQQWRHHRVLQRRVIGQKIASFIRRSPIHPSNARQGYIILAFRMRSYTTILAFEARFTKF